MLTIATVIAVLQAAPVPQPADTASNPPAQPASACSGEDFKEFQFWVGEWEVTPNGGEKPVANSSIKQVSSGCVVREHWQPFSGADGVSMTMRNLDTGRWEQVWVGSDGRRVDFTGGLVEGKMVLTGYWDDVGGPGQDALVRMTYSANDDGSVRQFGEASTDQGLSWQTSFDLIYRPRKDQTQ